mgnify:CR=1 FL=1
MDDNKSKNVIKTKKIVDLANSIKSQKFGKTILKPRNTKFNNNVK